jgi:general secretion pathway protein D
MRWISIVLVWLVPVAAFAGEDVDESIYNCKPRSAEVAITFKPEVELKELLTWVVGFTCKKFVLDPRIVSTGKKVTLIAPGKQTPAQAYDMFTTALAAMGLTVVPKGSLMQIVDAAASKTHRLPIYDGKVPAGSEQVVRYVLRPTHAQAETLRQAVTPFKSDAGDVAVVGTLLLLTDHGSNVRDMVSIAKLVDVPGGSDGIYTIPIRHADATKLAEKLGSLLGVHANAPAAPRGKGEVAMAPASDASLVPSKILVDDRTNTLIVAASEAGYQRVRALVERLDIALDIEGGTSMHVYQLGSAVAEELAKTLNEAISTGQGAQSNRGGGAPAAPGTPPSSSPLGAMSIDGPVRVIADRPTNKVIVMSSGRDFIAIREVIRELDVPRRQVYIEALILEVQLSNGLSLGTSGHAGYEGSDGSLIVGGSQMIPGVRTTDVSTLANAGGLIGGLIGKALPSSQTLLGKSIPSYAVLFNALADSANTNILSSMPIIVVDNEQAKYQVGTNVPYKKGVLPTSPTETSTLSTNIERQKLVLALDIKPHISTDDSILLEVKQSSSDMVDDSNTELGPTWTERSVDTRVLVRDQQTIVLGGLTQMRETEGQSKVPLLGDIPLLGYLFKYTKKSRRKMNLLILLTPYIVKDHLELEAIRARKQREYDEFARSFRHLDGKPFMPRIDYRRKRGVIEEINRTVADIEADIAARAAITPRATVKAGLVDVAPAGAEVKASDVTVQLPLPRWHRVSALLQ